MLVFFSLFIVFDNGNVPADNIMLASHAHKTIRFYSFATTIRQPHPIWVSEKAKPGQLGLRVGYQYLPNWYLFLKTAREAGSTELSITINFFFFF